ncbi:hypothetical protein GCM10009123_02260 [Kangiella japonica]|uniref:histidinol-phosphate transaminase n=1 Tax=Kangiella japonica TaxID=647384 RepID=A0ABN0STT9_9GAMM
MKPLYQNPLLRESAKGGARPLKLDFNERSDNKPLWLSEAAISTECLWRYPEKSGLQALASQFHEVGEEQLLLTNGGDEAIEILFKFACLNQRKLILPLPAFSQYLVGKNVWNSDIDLVEPQDDMRIDLLSAQDLLNNDSILILTSPNNPTGELIPFDDLVQTCGLAKSKGALLFLDEAYIEFACYESDKTIELIKQFDNLIVLRTLSKAFGLAGIRCGYLLGQEALVSQFSRLAMPFNLPSSTIEVAKKAFTEAARLEVSNYALSIAQNREQIVSLLTSSGLRVVDSSANFVFIQGSEEKLRLITAACQKRNILIKTTLTGLSVKQSSLDQTAIRITIPFYIKPLLSALNLALKPELLCFDMDGVLIDTSKSYDEAIKATVKSLSGETVTQIDIERLRSQGGYNNDWVLAQALTAEKLNQLPEEIDFDKVIEVFQMYYQGNGRTEGFKTLEQPLLNKALATRFFITGTKSLKTAIVTGRPKEEAIEGASLIGAKNSLMVSDDDVVESKPSPEGVVKALQYYGKENCWMLGDTPDDMAAANGAGALAIGIGSDELYDFGADLVLESVNELENLL